MLRSVSICFDDEQFYEDLKNYKGTLLTDEQRQELQYALASILHKFLVENRGMYTASSPLVVSWIPSTWREHDPMEWIAKAVFRERARLILEVAGEVADEGRRTPELGRFNVVEDVRGMTVLLLDDLVTSGSHLFSAAGALKQAGAREVRAVALGRFVRASEFPSYKAAAKKEPYSWSWPTDEDNFLRG